MKEAREPRTVSETRSFLGLLNYCGRFIPDLATVSEPLRRLTKSGTPFVFGGEQKKALQELKQRSARAETLGYFDKNALTQVIADASPFGLRAVLTQKQKNGQRVICCASRSLTDTERRYSRQRKRRWLSYGPAKSSIPTCMECHLILLQITSRWKLFTAQGQNPAHALKDGCYECSHTNSRLSMSLGRVPLLTPSQG